MAFRISEQRKACDLFLFPFYASFSEAGQTKYVSIIEWNPEKGFL
jgi:hypothetical protein